MTPPALTDLQRSLLVDLKHAGIVMFGESIRAKYGLGPPIYLDLRENLYERSDLMWRIGGEFACKIRDLALLDRRPQGIIGVPDTATPLALAAALYAWQEKLAPPLQYVLLRQQGKVYGSAPPSYVIGRRASPEFEYNLIDDVMASGLSKWKAIEKLRGHGIHIRRIVVFFDRQQGGTEMLEHEGYSVDAIFKLHEVVDFYLEERLISSDEHRAIVEFLQTHRFHKPLWSS